VARQILSSLNADLPEVKRYGLAVVSLAPAHRLAIPFKQIKQSAFPDVGFPLFQLAIALTVRSARPYSGILAVVLSGLPEQQPDQFFHTFFNTKRHGIGI
jgi:hypothetical protein